jgi:hypothetical protein
MAIQRVARFVPPVACRHEGTTRLASGALACVECGYEWPAPKEPEWVKRARAHTLPTKDYSGLSMAPGEWQELFGR